MVSKSSAPHSIRFKNDLWAKVLVHAADLDLTPNEAVVFMVEAFVGRQYERPAAVAPVPEATTPPKVAAPLYERPKFSPQPKKGSKK